MKTQILRRALACGLIAFTVMSAASAPSALAGHQYIFDPQLSLTGGCTTDEVDPVADPGCPYEAFPAGPSEPLTKPTGVTTDSYGNVYLAVEGPSSFGVPSNPHLDVFDAVGHFLTEVATPAEPKTVAVDSEGYLYVYTNTIGSELLRYDPAPSYDAGSGVIAFEPTPTVIDPGWSSWAYYASLAVNPENDHLFVNLSNPIHGERSAIVEFGSGAEGTPLLDDEVAEAEGSASGFGLAIDQSRGRIYATDQEPDVFPSTGLRLIRVFELAAPHNLIETLDGASLPDGTFVKCGFEPENCQRPVTIAVDEATGHLFVYDIERKQVVYELDEGGQYLATIDYELLARLHAGIAVDNGAESPNGALRPEGRYLWAVASPNGIGHAFAFAPREECPPVVESTSVAHVGESEAQLRAEVEPCQLETSYRFEYVSAQQFAASGFEAARLAGAGTIASGGEPITVSAGAAGLAPGTEYVFRAVATTGFESITRCRR